MNTKNDVEVIINNKKYILSGYESGEYLQRVASYINNKHMEFKLTEGYSKLDLDMKNVLLEINIADDYFRVQNQIQELEEENERKDKEIFELKNDVVITKSKLEETEKKLNELNETYIEVQKKVVKLETELKERSQRK